MKDARIEKEEEYLLSQGFVEAARQPGATPSHERRWAVSQYKAVGKVIDTINRKTVCSPVEIERLASTYNTGAKGRQYFRRQNSHSKVMEKLTKGMQ